MTTITEELVRKRAEHNEGRIGSLEEISLHQQNIIKIENLQNWCKDLKIVFLQSNVISRIENLWKLKKLEYLNLALNNIECIENLEGCESLQKLDLTLNFIGELTSVNSLKNNYNLKELFLTGNPCWQYDGYREYVITTLPQLKILDNLEILRSHRITASQNYQDNVSKILLQQAEYAKKREMQKQSAIEKKEENDSDNPNFWNEMSYNTPETRIAMMEHFCKSKENIVDLSCPSTKRIAKFFKNDGSPLNINEAKIPFTLVEDEEGKNFVLTIEIYKHLDTNLLDVDVQPWFVRVMIKGKVLQLVLPEEVHPDQCKAQRGTCSGKLVITMPKEKRQLHSTANKPPSNAIIVK